jgi:hypothetical protein
VGAKKHDTSIAFRLLFAGVAAFLGFGAAAACLGPVPLEDRSCPCASDFLCCEASNKCLSMAQFQACPSQAGDDASAEDEPGEASAEAAELPLADAAPVDATEEVPPDASPDAGDATVNGSPEGGIPPVDGSPDGDAQPSEDACVAAAGPTPDAGWRSMAPDGMAARSRPVFVWADDGQGGGQLAVWGGFGATGGGLADGKRYSPASDKWSPISSSWATPTSRGGANAVWTGKRVLIHGGSSQAGGTDLLHDPVWQYDPQADTWFSGTPSPHDTPAALMAWAGSPTNKLLLFYFGGQGATYDPDTDTWGTMSSIGAPCIALSSQSPQNAVGSAVWTGKEWILWGGRSCYDGYDGGQVYANDTYTNDGAAYDPVANKWTPISVVGAPLARYGHVAAWTGSEMIIWGGWYDGVTPAASGGVYDRATDTWRQLSVTLPLPTTETAVVGIPGGMIVWSGLAGYNPTANGGQIEGCTGNSWILQSTGQPFMPRNNASAVWTGTTMIGWGGEATVQTEVAGGIYVP